MNARADFHLGLMHGMPNAEYHSVEALSASGLRHLARSPRHYFAATLDPHRPVSEPTAAMKAGTLAHCALLEPDALFERYVIKPPGQDGRTKEGKAWLASVPVGLEVCSAEQMATAKTQAVSVRYNLPEVAKMLATGQPEVSAFWVDESTGAMCKCRPDWVHETSAGTVLLDLKTTTDASLRGFPRSLANFGYHRQAAHYSDGFALTTGVPVVGFVFVCVESDWPHAAAAYILDDESMAVARDQNRELMNLYAECKASGEWPGYPNEIQSLALPAWCV